MKNSAEFAICPIDASEQPAERAMRTLVQIGVRWKKPGKCRNSNSQTLTVTLIRLSNADDVHNAARNLTTSFSIFVNQFAYAISSASAILRNGHEYAGQVFAANSIV